ncbi:hypothetical protein M569_02115 [Genlisea aurea]|uniref:Uncharacterized protein n=1 Tax=Genlisea aurea TaxID=192259 RepID=S8EJ44_9LAMI|nr:hypothetical protein M569_02115 [Genlisea aurea]
MDVPVSGTTSKYDAKQGADHPDAETSSSETVPSKIKLNRSTDEDKQDTVKDTEVVIGETVVNSDHGLTSEFSVPRGSSELESHTQDEDELPQTGQVKTAADVQTIPEHQEKKASESAVEVQEQLDEAQGLLRSANSKGQSKEARLARVCAGLSARLQEYKSENSQLEELLVAEKELTRSYEAHIKQLKKDLTTSKDEANKAESNMLEALAAKNAEIESLISSVDSLKKQAALAEENLAALQAF